MSKLYFLDQAGSRILSCRTDGSELRTVIAGCTRHPDGIAIDAVSGYLYWTNMGGDFKRADGSIERARLDGSERRTIVAEGLTFTPKQILIDRAAGLLYWCDREGMRVMRARQDGSGIEVLVQTGATGEERLDARNWCVGIALDTARGLVYWTQKGPPSAGAAWWQRPARQHRGRCRHPFASVFESGRQPTLALGRSRRGDRHRR